MEIGLEIVEGGLPTCKCTSCQNSGKSSQTSVFPDNLLETAIEAVEHVAQANWNGREQAAKRWLRLVFAGKTQKSLDEIQEEINEE